VISDKMLERLLRDAAATFAPPAEGPRAVLAASRPRRALPRISSPESGRPRRRVWSVAAAAAALVTVSAAGGALLTSGGAPGQPPPAAKGQAAGRAASPGPAGAPAAAQPTADANFSSNRGPAAAGDARAGRPAAQSGPQTARPPAAAAAPADGARIVKTGAVSLEVAKKQVGPTLDRLTSLAAVQGGYVASSTTIEGSATPAGSVRLRVPARSFEDTLKQVRGFGTVQSVSAAGRDVTATYVDLAARLRALQATRSTYLTLLSKARTIGETLAVQQQVDGVQQQIEQLEGQRKVLADASDLATLDVRVAEKGTAAAVVKPSQQSSGLERAFSQAFHGFARGVYALIAASGPALLLLICLGVLMAASWVGYRMLRRRLV